MPDLFGFLNINKPSGMTSHDVVNKVRRKFNMRRVGHAGTLDPLATGVLVVCVGTATRLSEYVMASRKTYLAQVHLGVTTTTYDAEGDVVRQTDSTGITRQSVEEILKDFVGEIDQLPPLYSAIKQGGRKLYELAREGKDVDRQPRRVRIDRLVIQRWNPPTFDLEVRCGSGTYIRSLAYDIGEKLGVGAYLSGLVRTSSGVFHIDDAVALDSLISAEFPASLLISPRKALADYPMIQLGESELDHIKHGRSIDGSDLSDGEVAMAFDTHENFVAILRSEHGNWQPHKVFSS